MGVIELFVKNLPYSLLIFIIPVGIYWMFKKEKSGEIENRVEVFFKGYTKGYYPVKVGKEEATFEIDGVKYRNPLLYFPRIEHDKKTGKTYRTYLFAEGVGFVDVPPMNPGDRDKVMKYLSDNVLITEDERKEIEKYNDEQFLTYVQFYNFDITQVTDRPMMKAYTTQMNFLSSLLELLMGRLKTMEGEGTSNMARLGYIAIGVLIGSGFTWAFSLKGFI